jgi:hypothetical protein
MEAMVGISLYNYPYLKRAKTLCLSFCLYLLFKIIGEEGRTDSAWKQRRSGQGEAGSGGQEGEKAQAMYAHMDK